MFLTSFLKDQVLFLPVRGRRPTFLHGALNTHTLKLGCNTPRWFNTREFRKSFLEHLYQIAEG